MTKITPRAVLPQSISFTEPLTIHPKEQHGETIADVAKKLEKDYALIHKFVKMHKKDISGAIISSLKDAWRRGAEQEIVNGRIGDEVKNMWRMYIIREEHGVKTKAARARGSQSFVDTGSYLGAMRIKVK